VLLSLLPWFRENGRCDVFAIGRLPLPELDARLAASVAGSRQLLVIEEHVARGGLGENLSAALAAEGVPFRLHHRHAQGYPGGRYGSQAYHQRQSGLDFVSLRDTVVQLLGSRS
jgi:transketolase